MVMNGDKVLGDIMSVFKSNGGLAALLLYVLTVERNHRNGLLNYLGLEHDALVCFWLRVLTRKSDLDFGNRRNTVQSKTFYLYQSSYLDTKSLWLDLIQTIFRAFKLHHKSCTRRLHNLLIYS